MQKGRANFHATCISWFMSFYQSIAQVYDNIFPVNRSQVAFLQQELDEIKRVLDVGCGTGTLSLALAKLGFSCVGLDLEPAMIAVARDNAKTMKVDAQFETADMGRVDATWPVPQCEAIVCLGNTLVHLPTDAVVGALRGFAQHLPPGGKLVVQILNYDRILDLRVTSLPFIDNDHLTFARTYGFESVPSYLAFNTELVVKATGQKLENTEPLYPLRPHELETLAREAGFDDVQLFGGFDRNALSGRSYACVLLAARA